VTNVIGGMTARTSAGLPVCHQLIIAGRERIAMALWLVTASWTDDEAELTQQWEVNVPPKRKRSGKSRCYCRPDRIMWK